MLRTYSRFTSSPEVVGDLGWSRKAIFMMCLVALLWVQPASARTRDLREPTDAEQRRILDILNRVDLKIKAAFKGQEALQDTMTGELKAIGAMRDPAQRKRAASSYRAKHLDAYKKILTRAGVDMSAVAREIQGVVPRFNVAATQDLQIVATYIIASSPRSVAPSSTSREIDDFVDSRERSCANLAGGEVEIDDSSIVADASAAVAGGCASTGTKTAAIEVPAGTEALRLDGSADLEVEAFAIGVAGVATASASASFHIEGGSNAPFSGVFVLAVAPLLWVSSEEESLNGSSINVELAPGSTRTLIFYTRARVLAAFIGGGEGKATVKRIKASLTPVP